MGAIRRDDAVPGDLQPDMGAGRRDQALLILVAVLVGEIFLVGAGGEEGGDAGLPEGMWGDFLADRWEAGRGSLPIGPSRAGGITCCAIA
jgi:hypothetical protein